MTQKSTMMTDAEIFIDYYNKIDKHLNIKDGFTSENSFSHKVRNSKNRVVKQYSEELITLGDLRNVIVHNPRIDAQFIAEPHPGTVKRIRKIHEEITNPTKVCPLFTKKVLGAREEDFINEILFEMKRESFSQFPVYNGQGSVIELINTNTIARWLAANLYNEGSFLMENVKVKDFIPEIEHKNNYVFIKKTSSIYDAYDLFIDSINKYKKNLDVLFITENGQPNERILGLISIDDIAGVVKTKRKRTP
jgi:CBS domain-containing protein